MLITGLGGHPSLQQIAFVDDETGEANDGRCSRTAKPKGFIANGSTAE